MGTRAAWDHPLVSPTCAAQGSASAEEDRPCAGGWGLPQSELGNLLGWVGGEAQGHREASPKADKEHHPCLTTATAATPDLRVSPSTWVSSWRIFSILFWEEADGVL